MIALGAIAITIGLAILVLAVFTVAVIVREIERIEREMEQDR